MPKVGWNAYKTINLKYTNQIVCEKYDSSTINKAIKQIAIDSATSTVSSADSSKKVPVKEEVKKEEAIKKEMVAKKEIVVSKENKPVVKEKLAEKPMVKQAEKTPAKSTSVVPAKTVVTDKSNTLPVAKTKDKTDTKKNK
jgi:cell division protein FtsQ